MSFAIWAVVIGVLLVTMALSSTLLKRLPLSTSMLYLLAGFGLGPAGWALMTPDPMANSVPLEHLAEIAVLISLFAAGLKLGVPLSDPRWLLPLRLASISMVLTVLSITLVAMLLFGLPLGAALVLGGILAPTDPVLASDVQVESAQDRDRLRFSLTGEGSINDGAAFPFVLLGLGLLGLHDLGLGGWRWLAVDVLWATVGGLALGGAMGAVVGKLVVYLRSQHKESVGLDEFLALGLIALSYGVTVLLHAYGFLAVFAAGLALRRVREQRPASNGSTRSGLAANALGKGDESPATHPAKASAFMMEAVKGFNEQLERIGEVAIVLVVGAMLAASTFTMRGVAFALVLFALIRPLSVWIGLLRAPVLGDQKILISWFGIRGIGSIYYLMFAINHGLSDQLGRQLIDITLTTVTISIVLHGISVTPLMSLYGRRKQGRVGT